MKNLNKKRRGNSASTSIVVGLLIVVMCGVCYWVGANFGQTEQLNENMQLKYEMRDLQDKIEEMETSTQNDLDELDDCNDDYDALEREYIRLQEDYDDLLNEIDRCEDQDDTIDELKSQVNSLRENAEKLEQQIIDLKTKHAAEIKELNEKHEKELADAKKSSTSTVSTTKYNNMKKKLNGIIDDLEDELKRTQDILDDYVSWFSPKPDSWIAENGWIPIFKSPQSRDYYVTTADYEIPVNGIIKDMDNCGSCIPEGPTGLVVGLRGYVNDHVPGTRVDVIGEVWVDEDGKWVPVIPNSPNIARCIYPYSGYKWNTYDLIIIDPGNPQRLENIRNDLNSGNAHNRYLSPDNVIVELVKFKVIFNDIAED